MSQTESGTHTDTQLSAEIEEFKQVHLIDYQNKKRIKCEMDIKDELKVRTEILNEYTEAFKQGKLFDYDYLRKQFGSTFAVFVFTVLPSNLLDRLHKGHKDVVIAFSDRMIMDKDLSIYNVVDILSVVDHLQPMTRYNHDFMRNGLSTLDHTQLFPSDLVSKKIQLLAVEGKDGIKLYKNSPEAEYYPPGLNDIDITEEDELELQEEIAFWKNKYRAMKLMRESDCTRIDQLRCKKRKRRVSFGSIETKIIKRVTCCAHGVAITSTSLPCERCENTSEEVEELEHIKKKKTKKLIIPIKLESEQEPEDDYTWLLNLPALPPPPDLIQTETHKKKRKQ